MTDPAAWNDAERDALRSDLRRVVLGEVRLSVADEETILALCREVHIDDLCPEDERAAFETYAREELARTSAAHEAEQRTWPQETDCDRLDRVQQRLQDRGILLWQVSPCCDTCTRSELGDRIAFVDERSPGFAEHARGYAFFIEQNMAEALAESHELTVHLGYGWLSPEGAPVPEEAYRKHAADIAEEVCVCLREQGFEPKWNHDVARKVELKIRWLRRGRGE